jgi:hypothetical protein
VLYIGGTGRSGSTLVERSLAQLPGVAAVGELRSLWRAVLTDDRRCSCGQVVSACAFWQEVGDRAFGGWHADHVQSLLGLQHAVDRHRRLPTLVGRGDPGSSKDVAALASAWTEVFRAIREARDARLVVDSSKYPAHAAVLRVSGGVDLRVVHLIRDPRGVAHSWSKPGIVKPDATQAGATMPVFGHGRTAAEWVAYNLAFDRIHALGTPTLRLRYESFVREPEASLRRVLAFIELPVSDGDLDFVGDGTISLREGGHAIGGNPERFDGGSLVTLRLDDAWRRDMPPIRRAEVSTLVWPLMRRYGYGRSSERSAS